ncbi:hypothetical protein Q3A66_11745 [Hymenobacter sp. BT770]|uniref:hypothetical protein n=1 Tax=Hymenobacter sp. BT770 TaxID=2886942 RepID=UPI001D118AC4|nr:hypothetical protein [Hymenobacter sp. BT770]MCC3153504.1 hypothetical protein [Hymenobacter sp. BT770]MDO3415741.1 hypothetical protein [Hymenobacter sp. BT770]
MNIRAELLREHSARQTKRLTDYACSHPACLAELLQVFWYGEPRERQLAADVLGWVGQRRPQWLVPHLPGLLAAAQPSPGQHPAVRRSVARVLQFVPVPEEWQALAFDTCLGMLQSPAEPVAIRVYALSAAVRLAMPYPELTSELLAAAENVLATTKSAVLHSRAEREFPKLRSVLREDLPG